MFCIVFGRKSNMISFDMVKILGVVNVSLFCVKVF